MSSNNYRAWLVQLAMHIGVRDCTKMGTTSLEEIREEMLDLGVLAGYERNGDVFLLELYRVGPFYHDEKNSSLFRKFDGAHIDDFDHPGPPPPLFDPPPVEPEAPKNVATGKKLPPKLGAVLQPVANSASPYIAAHAIGYDAHGPVFVRESLPRGAPVARTLPPIGKPLPPKLKDRK